MPVPADGWTMVLGMWGTASVAVAALFAWVMRGTGQPTPARTRPEQVPCACLGCLRLRRSA